MANALFEMSSFQIDIHIQKYNVHDRRLMPKVAGSKPVDTPNFFSNPNDYPTAIIKDSIISTSM
jgi:hypothetical protein